MDKDKKIDLQTLPYILIKEFHWHSTGINFHPTPRQYLCSILGDTLRGTKTNKQGKTVGWYYALCTTSATESLTNRKEEILQYPRINVHVIYCDWVCFCISLIDFLLFIYKKKRILPVRPCFSWGHSQRSSRFSIWCRFRSRFCECRWIYTKNRTWKIKSKSIWFTFILQIASIGKRTKRRKSATFKRAAIATSINEIYLLLILYLNSPITPKIKPIFNKLIVLHFGGVKELVSRFLRRNPSSSTLSVNRTRMTSQTRTNHQRVSKLLANRFGDSIEVLRGSGLRCSSNAQTNQPRRRKRHSFRVYTYISRISFTQ